MVLAEKVFKPLQAILDAYEARLRPNQTNEERLRVYLDQKIEKQRLDIFQKMIQVTQMKKTLQKNCKRQQETKSSRNLLLKLKGKQWA